MIIINQIKIVMLVRIEFTARRPYRPIQIAGHAGNRVDFFATTYFFTISYASRDLIGSRTTAIPLVPFIPTGPGITNSIVMVENQSA
jgi:hypothetical protein